MSGAEILALLVLLGVTTAIVCFIFYAINHWILGLYDDTDTTTTTWEKIGTYTYIVVVVLLVCLSATIVCEVTQFNSSSLLSFALISLIGSVALTIVPQYYQHQIHILEHPDALGGASPSLVSFGFETVILLFVYAIVIFVALLIISPITYKLKPHLSNGIAYVSSKTYPQPPIQVSIQQPAAAAPTVTVAPTQLAQAPVFTPPPPNTIVLTSDSKSVN